MGYNKHGINFGSLVFETCMHKLADVTAPTLWSHFTI